MALLEDEFSTELDKSRFTDERNIGETLKMLAKGSMSAYKVGNKSVKMFDTIRDFKTLRVAKVAKNVETNGLMVESVANTAVSMASAEASAVNSAVAQTAVQTTGRSAGKLAFRGASAAVGLAFVAMDVYSLVQDWSKTHPTLQTINSLLRDMRRDATVIRKIHLFLQSVYCSDEVSDDVLMEVLQALDEAEGRANGQQTECQTKPKSLNSDSQIDMSFDDQMVFYFNS